MRKINEAGLDLIKKFEGCKLVAYPDVVGIITIGYGHAAPDVVRGLVWTQDYADQVLQEDLDKFEQGVENLLTTEVNDNQFSALVAFAFNVGLFNLSHSTLLKKVNSNDFDGAVQEFVKWDHAGGKTYTGLLNRRLAEQALFRS